MNFLEELLLKILVRMQKDASPKSVLEEYLSPILSTSFVVNKFLQREVLRNLSERLVRHKIKVDEDYDVVQGDADSQELYTNYVRFFNPEVVYRYFARYSGDDSNLSVLERRCLSEEDSKALTARGERWIDVLYPLEKQKNSDFWMWSLSNRVEALIARANPLVERCYIHEGKVIGFADRDYKDWPLVGMIVDGFTGHPHSLPERLASAMPLINAGSQERFGHLLGQKVRYHFMDIVRDWVGTPYGELITVPSQLK